ncbi:MAG: glycosyltransferase [Burkholderiales bacterium]
MPAAPRVDILNIGFFDGEGVRAYTGGAERYVIDLARLLSVFGLRPRLLQNARLPFTREFEGFEVVGIPASPRFDLAMMSAGFADATRDAALVIASPVELASRIHEGPPVIGINHGVWWDLPGHRAAHPELSDREPLFTALRRLTACVAVDTNFVNWLRASGEAAPRVDYIPNYVDHARFRPVAKDFEAPRLSVLFPRRLCAERGFHETMRAFDMLWAEGVPCDLHLCGGGAQAEEDLAREFVARHPGRARWSEAVPGDMPAVYATSHAVIVPTLFSEGTSLSCLEAMATNNGVVATHVGGLPNLVIDEVNGLLVAPGAAALAAAVRRLVRDRQLLATIAARAQDVAATFGLARWQARWSAVLRDVLPALGPAIERWSHGIAMEPAQGSHGPDAAERELRALRAALQDADARLRIAMSEREGAYRAAAAATFDRDAARAARDAAPERLLSGTMDRDAARPHASASDAHEREAQDRTQAAERELAHLRARMATLVASRGVRWLRALDREGRFLLPPVEVGADRRSTPAQEPVAAHPPGELGPSGQNEHANARPRAMRAECCGLVGGLVSVVLPVYNGADMAAGSIRSVLAQTHEDLELIVIDDGSTDALDAVLAEFAGDPRMRVVHQPNGGLPRALTNGFALARGEFWTWTSADNLMAPRQIERMVARLASAPDVGMVYADYWLIDERGNPLANPHWRSHNRPDPASGEVRLPRTTERLNTIPDNFIGPCFLYRGWIGRILGAYRGQQGVEDYDYWMRVNGYFEVAHLGTGELLYWYRVHANTLSARAGEERIPHKIERLMTTERDRAHWRGLPLAVHLDRDLAAWHARHPMPFDVSLFDDALRLTATPAGPSVLIASVRRTAASTAAGAPGSTIPLVVVVEEGSDIPDDVAAVLRRPHVLVAVSDAKAAERIAALASVPMVDAEAPSLGAAVAAFARHASYVARFPR